MVSAFTVGPDQSRPLLGWTRPEGAPCSCRIRWGFCINYKIPAIDFIVFLLLSIQCICDTLCRITNLHRHQSRGLCSGYKIPTFSQNHTVEKKAAGSQKRLNGFPGNAIIRQQTTIHTFLQVY